MFSKDQWPCTPTSLSEVLDAENIAVIEAGSCERIKRPLKIVDRDRQTGKCAFHIPSLNQRQRFEEFCRFLRDENTIQGGEKTCTKWDEEKANDCLTFYLRDGKTLFRQFPCHMGLIDMTYIIQVGNQPVALLFTGQYGSENTINEVEQQLEEFGLPGKHSDIKTSPEQKEILLELAKKLSPVPLGMRQQFIDEAKRIEKFAGLVYENQKRVWQQEFLDEIRSLASTSDIKGMPGLKNKISQLLDKIRFFCHCNYVIFFGSVQQGDTILIPLALSRESHDIEVDLPHFNWKKAGLPLEQFNPSQWDIEQNLVEVRKGIRGDNRELFDDISCVIPTTMDKRFRGILVLGPFAEHVDVQKEQNFLKDVANTITLFALTGLEMLYLERERERWESTAILLTHQVKTALTPIAYNIGWIREIAQGIHGGVDKSKLESLLKTTEDQALLLADSAKETLMGHVLEVTKEDLTLDWYPLSVLVENCANGFTQKARMKNVELVIDNSIEMLPKADVDVARLTITFANLVDNAIKYSFPGTKVYIHSSLRVDIQGTIDQAAAEIVVQNTGFEIHENEREHIFGMGTRGAEAQKAAQIKGSGFGLWEAQSIVKAHKGEINLQVETTNSYWHGNKVCKISFSVKIPLNQSKHP
jgi:signal transduction histidine kinase